MVTVFDIEESVLECKSRGEAVLISEEERLNVLLDQINSFTKALNELNECFIQMFGYLDKLSSCKVDDRREIGSLTGIMNELSQFSTRSSILFARMSKLNIISNGCKTPLLDLRINIRTLREYIEDLEDIFLLEDSDELNSFIEDLIND